MEIVETKKITFKQRPLAVSINYRIHSKIVLILLILKLNSRGSKASPLKIHFFVWALRNPQNQSRVRDLITSRFSSYIEFWGLEPALTRALEYATSEGLITIEKASYSIAEKGEQFLKLIQNDPQILPSEKAFLIAIGKGISDDKLKKIATWAQKDA
ncbi:hypothetical protein [Spirosoma rhododendri]|uniref:Uncharacterized protein n=1 Tax=Spirosoma rhododendri TaxID=2728024 RepID=A0A7L5DPT2_9BACT|nr:hypothetical protein [Spirosoma rhododendri]QJD79592.1 hypothetical protein HH216_15080 [Spirosoma rhododendri]